MGIIQILIIMIAALFFSAETFAEEDDIDIVFDYDIRWLSIMRSDNMKFVLADEVSDGCWINPSASTTAVQLELIRSKYGIEEDASNIFLLSALGFETGNNSCSVFVSARVYVSDSGSFFSEEKQLLSLYRRQLWNAGTLLTGPKSDMSERVRAAHIEFVQEFLVEIEKQKSSLKEELETSSGIGNRDTWLRALN